MYFVLDLGLIIGLIAAGVVLCIFPIIIVVVGVCIVCCFDCTDASSSQRRNFSGGHPKHDISTYYPDFSAAYECPDSNPCEYPDSNPCKCPDSIECCDSVDVCYMIQMTFNKFLNLLIH